MAIYIERIMSFVYLIFYYLFIFSNYYFYFEFIVGVSALFFGFWLLLLKISHSFLKEG